MDERMTLEQVRDWLLARTRDGQMQRSVFTSDYQLRQMADAITANLTQPAQAVDVEKVKEVIDELREAEDADASMASEWFGGMADKLTRAIGNAQAEGWRLLAAGDVIKASDQFIADNAVDWVPVSENYIFVGMEYRPGTFKQVRRKIRPTPPTQATPNAHE